MGILYSAIPINAEAREWLASEGIASPDIDGRHPTPNELKSVLDALEDQVIEYSISESNWQAQINDRNAPEAGPWTLLNVQDYHDDPDARHKFYFAKGWPELIVQVVYRISKVCGPYVVVPDVDCCPVIVQPDSDLDELLDRWGHLAGD